MAKPKIPFGLLNGRMVTPAEVPRGLACGCVCAECGGRLIAKHPTSNIVKHFSHYHSESCAKGFETALHKAAKQVLLDKKMVLLPSVSASAYRRDDISRIYVEVPKSIPSRMIELDSVVDEARGYEGIIPDIVATVGNKLLLIEIAVTHFVDQEKLDKLKALGLATLEIDLSESPEVPTMEDIERLVIYTGWNRDWLVNPKQKQLEEVANIEAEARYKASVAAAEAQRKEREEELQRYRKLADREKFEFELRGVTIHPERLARIIGHKDKCDFSIVASPRTWQLAIYKRFVYKLGSWDTFNASEVYDWISKRFVLKETDDFKDAPKIAIHYYLQHLLQLKLIGKGYGRGQYEVWA